MIKYPYLFIVNLIEFILPMALFFAKNKKVIAFIKGRQLVIPKLQKHTNRYWFHCASLGEFEQAKPLIEALKRSELKASIVISFFSPSGYEQQKDYKLADLVIYLPLDTPKNAKKIIELLQPNVVVFIKYEIWYFLLKALFNKKIPVYLISATFRPNQFIFSIWGRWLFNLLPQYSNIFIQDITSYNLLKSKELNNILLTGDTRFDRVLENSKNVIMNDIIEKFKINKFLIILGSSWEIEEDLIFNYLLLKKRIDFKVLIAPHNAGELNIQSILKKFEGFKAQQYTKFDESKETNILILDTIGHLASAYYYGNLAFIGGGFTGALHNILEPLSFGLLVITGQNLSKFPEATLAEKEGVLSVVSSLNFNQQIDRFLALDIKNQKLLNNQAKDFILKNTGATGKVADIIKIS